MVLPDYLLICVSVCSEVTNPVQIMFSVLHGMRPDTSLNSLPVGIPSRDTLISLMTSGWTSNPDDRPSFLSTSHTQPVRQIAGCCAGSTFTVIQG